jgi:hypothetical protein
MDNLVDKGFARLVPINSLQQSVGKLWYLPHHPVFSQSKADKIRVVFDCAAVYRGTSLNEQLLQGPEYVFKMADASEILNSPTLKNFSLDRVDIPSIKLLNIKTHLVYDGTRIKWSNDLISLKNFTENIVGLVGCWRSPDGKSKQFVSNMT